MKKNSIKVLTFNAVFTALYVTLVVINPLSYGPINLYLGSIMAVFAFWDRRFVIPVLAGTVIANIFSPIGLVDAVLGFFNVTIAYYVIALLKKRYIAIPVMAIYSASAVGLMLSIAFQLPFWSMFGSVLLGDSICYIIGTGIAILFAKKGIIRDEYIVPFWEKKKNNA